VRKNNKLELQNLKTHSKDIYYLDQKGEYVLDEPDGFGSVRDQFNHTSGKYQIKLHKKINTDFKSFAIKISNYECAAHFDDVELFDE
jgi:hypothetical protein